jgi:hypothetical protein
MATEWLGLKKSLIMSAKAQSPNLLGVNKLLAKEPYLMDEIIWKGVEDIEVE